MVLLVEGAAARGACFAAGLPGGSLSGLEESTAMNNQLRTGTNKGNPTV